MKRIKFFRSLVGRFRTSIQILLVSFISVFLISNGLSIAYCQGAPEAINYQSVARDLSGTTLPNRLLGVQVTIRNSNSSGPIDYQEIWNVQTNSLGIYNLQIGRGTVVIGDFSMIDWGVSAHFAEIAIDINGGTSYVVQGTSELLSVPYALYAKNVETISEVDGDTTNELQQISLDTNNVLKISNGNSIYLPYDSSHWKSNSPDLYYQGGNIGIGLVSPDEKLHLSGYIRSDSLAGSSPSVIIAEPNGRLNRMGAGNPSDVLYSGTNGPYWDSPIEVQTTNPVYGGGTFIQRNVWIQGPLTLTVNTTGQYKIDWIARMYGLGANDYWWRHRIYNVTQNLELGVFFGMSTFGSNQVNGDNSSPGSCVRNLNAGDVIRIDFFASGNGTTPITMGDVSGASIITIMKVGN